MSAWRRKAIEAAPELSQTIQRSCSAMAAWIELRFSFKQAVKRGDMQQSRRILDYARYCLAAPSAEINTAVVFGFIEHLAEDDVVRSQLPKLISARELKDWRTIMLNHAGEEEIEKLEAALRLK
ncbi:DUF7674 family protein [Allorhizobium taibaishanense]|uniref:DUF7674 domain-containing protein n=1 Tax=Allorhizobium taibaishanense TaxID=887144 RepID=A0A1Q9AB92_9HYPH|nr:hypothetical protein [Allorhizobium taibaishanense]MBB4010111.1 hypothetical protein [Allorhizobium taibaishanense]OLP52124.1 hypothetical protein BJF91_02460 [Allorhizobium taibaishanense]